MGNNVLGSYEGMDNLQYEWVTMCSVAVNAKLNFPCWIDWTNIFRIIEPQRENWALKCSAAGDSFREIISKKFRWSRTFEIYYRFLGQYVPRLDKSAYSLIELLGKNMLYIRSRKNSKFLQEQCIRIRIQ